MMELLNFLMEEIEDIVFLYNISFSSLQFSQYSVDLLGISKYIENPLQNEELNRFSSVMEQIHGHLVLDGNKNNLKIQWMNKSFLVHYQQIENLIVFRIKENLYE